MTDSQRYVALLLVLGLGWGSTQPLGKIAASSGHGNFALIFWQLVISVIVLGCILLVQRKRFALNLATFRFATLIALIGTLIPNSTFYISVVHLPAGVMSILISMVPLIAFPIAIALGMDKFNPRRAFGLLCGLAGVALIALPRTSLPDPGMARWLPVAIIGPLFYAIEGNVVAKWGTAGLDAAQAMFVASVVGALMALPLMLATGQWFSPMPPYGKPELALVLSSCLHAFLYTGYVWLASRAGAVFAAQTSYVVTAAGLCWAAALLDERFSLWVFAALGVMFLGLFLVTPRPRSAAGSLIHNA